MRCTTLTALAPLVFILLTALAFGAENFIIKDGVALGRIHAPAQLCRSSAFAVEELQTHLVAITGAKVEVAWRDLLPNESGIVLKVKARDEWFGKASAQGYAITQTASPAVVTIAGNTHLAVLYGVYAYLESLGVRWYTPGEIGTDVPSQSFIEVTPGVTDSEPVCILRSLGLSGTANGPFGAPGAERDSLLYDYSLWTLRNRLHFCRRIYDLKNSRFDFNRPPYGGGHALRRIAGLERLFPDKAPAAFETSPGRWPMLVRNFEKVRTDQGPHQICFTDEENIREAIENCARRHREIEAESNDLQEAAAVSLSLADCPGICECEACQKVAGEDPNSKDRLVWSFMNRVARGLNDRMPGRKILLYAPYYELTQPPPDVKIEPNIIAVSCRSYSWNRDSGQAADDPFPPSYRQWITRTHEAGAEQAVYDYVLMSSAPQPLDILDAFKEYRALGYRYYQPEVMQRSEQTWPILWALAKASWGSEQSPRELFAGFCRDYYGEENGKLVVDLLETMTANSRNIRRICYGSAMNSSVMLPEGLVTTARTRLRAAVRSAAPGKPAMRMKRFSDSMEVHFRMGEMYRAYADALNYRTPDKIGTIRGQVADFMRFWNENHVARIFSSSALNLPKLILEKDFAVIRPAAAKNEYHNKTVLLKTIFNGQAVPETLADLFVLPEIWRLKLDPRGVGVAENWSAPDLDDEPSNGWQPMSSWNFIERQGYGDNRLIDGDFWYRVVFQAPAFAADKRVMLRLAGLDDEGTLYLNGVKVAERRSIDGHSWNTPFAVDVTDAIQPGKANLLAVHGYDAEGAGGVWLPSALYTEP